MNLNNLDWVTIRVNPIDDNITSRKANIRSYIWWQVLIYVLCVECVFSCWYIWYHLGLYWIYDEARFCFQNFYIVTTSHMLMPLFVFLLWCRPHPCLYIVYTLPRYEKFCKISLFDIFGFLKKLVKWDLPTTFLFIILCVWVK